MRVDELHFIKTLTRTEYLLFVVVTGPLPSLCRVEYVSSESTEDDVDVTG